MVVRRGPREAPFGRGRTAARVLARVIDVAAWLGARVPPSITHRLAVVGGTIEWAVRPHLRERLSTNLAHVAGVPVGSREASRLARAELVNEARRSADLLWAIGNPDEFAATVRVDGAARVVDAARRGNGVVLVGLHFGGWEVAASVPAKVVPVRTHVIVADDWLAWAIEHVRRAAGLETIPRSRAALAALRALRAGEAVLVMGDDAFPGPEGEAPRTHTVELCGARARLPAGSVTLARLAGAPIVPFHVLPEGPRHWRVVIEPELAPPRRATEEPDVLQQLADRWTALLRCHPTHWAARFAIAWELPE